MTEPGYFKHVKNVLRDSLVVIELAEAKGDPLALVKAAMERRGVADKAAKKERDENLRYDEVWCVVDCDSHARLGDAKQLASRVGIDLAISNPCFELWALLHLDSQSAHISTSETVKRLRSNMSNYKKELDIPALRGRYELARGRAQGLEARHIADGSPGDANPSTAVWRVVDSLLASAAKAGLSITSADL